jgi:hypothetical protein
MGQALFPCLRFLEKQLERDRDLLQVSSGSPGSDLYDESDRKSESAGQEGGEEQIDFSE